MPLHEHGAVRPLLGSMVLAIALGGCSELDKEPDPPQNGASQVPGIEPGKGEGEPGPGGQGEQGDASDKGKGKGKGKDSASPEPSKEDTFVTKFARAFFRGYDPLNNLSCETEDEYCLVNYDRADVALVQDCSQRTLDVHKIEGQDKQAPYLDCIVQAQEFSQDCLELVSEACGDDADEATCIETKVACTDTFRAHLTACDQESPDNFTVFNGLLFCLHVLTQDTGG